MLETLVAFGIALAIALLLALGARWLARGIVHGHASLAWIPAVAAFLVFLLAFAALRGAEAVIALGRTASSTGNALIALLLVAGVALVLAWLAREIARVFVHGARLSWVPPVAALGVFLIFFLSFGGGVTIGRLWNNTIGRTDFSTADGGISGFGGGAGTGSGGGNVGRTGIPAEGSIDAGNAAIIREACFDTRQAKVYITRSGNLELGTMDDGCVRDAWTSSSGKPWSSMVKECNREANDVRGGSLDGVSGWNVDSNGCQ